MGETIVKLLKILEDGIEKGFTFFVTLAVFNLFEIPVPDMFGALVLTGFLFAAWLVVLFIRCAVQVLATHLTEKTDG